MSDTPVYTMRIPKELKDYLRETAKKNHTTMAHVVIEAINQYRKSNAS